jgi:hypothetical protein
MVVTALPAASLTATLHERTALPSTWTLQAPQAAMPQPNFGAGQPQLLAQRPEQRRVGFGLERDRLAIDR